MNQHRRICITIVLVALFLVSTASVLLLQKQEISVSERNNYPSFRFGFAEEADIPALIEDALSPEHLVEEISAEGGTPSTAVYDGKNLAPWLLNCEMVELVEHIDDSVYVTYHPTEPKTCDIVILHYQDGHIVDIATSWNNGSHFIEADLVNGWISGG